MRAPVIAAMTSAMRRGGISIVAPASGSFNDLMLIVGPCAAITPCHCPRRGQERRRRKRRPIGRRASVSRTIAKRPITRACVSTLAESERSLFTRLAMHPPLLREFLLRATIPYFLRVEISRVYLLLRVYVYTHTHTHTHTHIYIYIRAMFRRFPCTLTFRNEFHRRAGSFYARARAHALHACE